MLPLSGNQSDDEIMIVFHFFFLTNFLSGNCRMLSTVLNGSFPSISSMRWQKRYNILYGVSNEVCEIVILNSFYVQALDINF